MATDDLGIDRDPPAVTGDLGITSGPAAPPRPTAAADGYGITYDPAASARPPRDRAQPGAPRTPQFSTGISGSPGSAAGLTSEIADSDRYNAMVPRQFSQHSVLQTSMPSSNGYSNRDWQERMLPGLAKPLPSSIGSSQDSWNKSLIMRLNGLDAQ